MSYLQSTDKKPLNANNFNGGYNNCLAFLHHHVRGMTGVVKYEFNSWTKFPTSVEQAKELAIKWSKSFEKRKDFSNKKVIIFFHLQMKTIRIAVSDKEK